MYYWKMVTRRQQRAREEVTAECRSANENVPVVDDLSDAVLVVTGISNRDKGGEVELGLEGDARSSLEREKGGKRLALKRIGGAGKNESFAYGNLLQVLLELRLVVLDVLAGGKRELRHGVGV